MATRDFDKWLSTMRDTINGYDYYVDFEKVYENAQKLKVELNILNSLIGSANIEEEFEKILADYPKVLRAIPILLAVRGNEIYAQDDNGGYVYNFKKGNQSVEQYKYFMRETGLFDLLQHHVISNIYDYVTGVEVGLSSNGRKNRGGHQMENLLERYIKKTGVEYYKEMYLSDVEEKWDVDLSAISANGNTKKRWDYVVKAGRTIYLFETNFYTSGGSKLNETARSYKMIAEEAANIPDVQFVWVTDGGGWVSARNNLHETFNVLPTIYNIKDLEDGVLNRLFEA